MLDDYTDHYIAMQSHIVTDVALAHEIQTRFTYNSQIYECIAEWLLQTRNLKGFTSSLVLGSHIGRNAVNMEGISEPAWFTQLGIMHVWIDEPAGEEGEEEEGDDVVEDDVDCMITFLEGSD
jgi:hypothetical protein